VKIVAKLQLLNSSTSSLTYPKKLVFRVTNPSTSAVVIKSLEFDMGAHLRGHPDRAGESSNCFKVEFLAYKDASGKDVYQAEILLKPGATVTAWLAMDNATDDATARDALTKQELGTWRYTTYWLDEPMELRKHEDRF
jgi:hypothetical protein